MRGHGVWSVSLWLVKKVAYITSTILTGPWTDEGSLSGDFMRHFQVRWLPLWFSTIKMQQGTCLSLSLLTLEMGTAIYAWDTDHHSAHVESTFHKYSTSPDVHSRCRTHLLLRLTPLQLHIHEIVCMLLSIVCTCSMCISSIQLLVYHCRGMSSRSPAQ